MSLYEFFSVKEFLETKYESKFPVKYTTLISEYKIYCKYANKRPHRCHQNVVKQELRGYKLKYKTCCRKKTLYILRTEE